MQFSASIPYLSQDRAQLPPIQFPHHAPHFVHFVPKYGTTMLVKVCRFALKFDFYSFFQGKWTCIQVWQSALLVAKRYGASVSEIHVLTGCSLTLEMLRFGPLFGHFLILGPIWKDAPRRELSSALRIASKHASSDDFEAFFCLTLNSNIFLQKLQLFDILRCPSCVNHAP